MHKTLPKNSRILLASAVAFLLAFLLVTFFRSSFQVIDAEVNLWTPTIRTSVLTTLALGIATVFETDSLALISIAISGLFFLKRRKHLGLLLFGAIGGDALFVAVFKATEQVARPINGFYATSSFSYPSGHSTAVVVFIGILTYIALRRYHNKITKVAIGTGSGVLVWIVGFDRIYLNVHWLSDVVGGWLFGVFWLSFAISMFVWLESTGKFCSKKFDVLANWLYVIAVAVSVLVVAYSFVV